jgi:enolase-phosphatase E1
LSLAARGVRALLLDIEGTTTPVDFVYRTLFPYARAHAAEYLRDPGDARARDAALAALADERRGDAARGEAVGEDVLSYVLWLMDRDRKSPGLKALQGLIWEEGYRSGELRGDVYADVPLAFARWRAAGRDIYIYSSGSVLAQRLLFGSTASGDLTTCLSGYFDTGVGPKSSAGSYRAIARRLGFEARGILFVSDTAAELDAAREAGLQTLLCVRPPRPESGAQDHPTVCSFDEIGE